MTNNRVVAWFSRGGASAVAAKLALAKYGDRCVVVNCKMDANEHSDNLRYAADVETWLGISVLSIASEKYHDVDDVFAATRYMSGIKGARCTTEMKKVPRFAFQRPDDIHIFGYTADEQDRIDAFEATNPELNLEWPLRDAGITKAECFGILKFAGIKRPLIYDLGFNNANCIGCVKVQSPKYWLLVKELFPEVFELRAKRSRELGVRLIQVTRRKGQRERIFLDELMPSMVRKKDKMPEVSCGPFCAAPVMDTEPETHTYSCASRCGASLVVEVGDAETEGGQIDQAQWGWQGNDLRCPDCLVDSVVVRDYYVPSKPYRIQR